MTSYVLTYRDVKGSDLVASEVDANFHNLDDRVTVLEADFETFNQIADLDIVGGELIVTMDDASEINAGEFPVVEWRPRGAWAPSTAYLVRDVFTNGGTLYKVEFNHTSDTTFDPAANDGMGNDYYSVVFEFEAAAAEVVNTTDDTISTITAFANSYVRCNSPTGTSIEILDDDTAMHQTNTEIHFRLGVSGASMVFTYDSDVTVNWPEDDFDLAADKLGAVVTLKKVGANEWDAFGLLSTASA